MKKKHSSFWPLALLVLCLAAPAGMQAQWKLLETDSLRLIYFPAEAFLANHTASCFENSLRFHKNLFSYTPSEKVNILLHDFGDYANAAAGAVPQNTILVTIAPFNYIFDTMPANERINAIMHHELVHILSSDMAAGSDRFFRSLFLGKVAPDEENPLTMVYGYLTTPRLYVPRWYMEGMAVFMETWMAGGYGRVLGCYDEMVFRTIMSEGSRVYDLVGLESAGTRLDFQVGVNSYLYGTRFFSYLALKYGPESLVRWVARPRGSRAYFSSQFRKVYGMPIDRAWSEWLGWEAGFQKQNLDSLTAAPLTPFQSVSTHALGSVSRAFHDARENKVYLGINYPGQVAHLASLDLATGKIKKICDVKGPALYYVCSLAYDSETGTLFYTTDNNAWRDLKRVDVHSRHSQTLIKDARVGDLAFNRADRSLWGVRHYNGISTLVRIPPPYREWKQVYSWPYGKDIYDIDISPDGLALVAALTEISGRQSLIKIRLDKLLAGELVSESLSDFENTSPANFVFSADGRTLYGSSYYSGVSNIYRCDLKTKKIEILTNTETGFFRPVPLADESLLVFRYSSAGFTPVVISSQRPAKMNVRAISMLGQSIADQYPVVRSWSVGSPTVIPIDSLVTRRGSYSPLRFLRLKTAYPVIEGYKDAFSFGWHFHFADAVSLEKIDLTASYSPDGALIPEEKLHLRLNVALKNWDVTFAHNSADFYDLFGPTKTSRKGQSLQLQYRKNLLYDEPNRFTDYAISAAAYFNLERMPEFQNIDTTFDQFYTLNFKFNTKYLRRSLGAIEDEKGYLWQFELANYYVNGVLYPRLHLNADFGIPLPLPHSSLWVRGAAGVAGGDREQPFANFYFGGFGNNWVDRLASRRFREYYAFPGLGLNEVGGKSFAKLTAEWTPTPLFFRRLGFPFFYANWASLCFFSGGLFTDFDSAPHRQQFFDVGVQLDLRLIALSHHQLTLSLGYARAFKPDGEKSDEWMVSLKI